MTLKELKELIASGEDSLDISELLPKKVELVVINPENATALPIPDGSVCQMRHSVNSGDLIAAMGCIKKYYDITKRKVGVMQTIDRQAAYYQGAVHPVLDANGRAVTCNRYMFDMLSPLIKSQEYIYEFEPYTGQRIDVDFDTIRGKTFVNMPHCPIQGWIASGWPDLSFDISRPWITLKDECPAHIKGQVIGKVILNFTDRYREVIDYFFLQNHAPELIFSGTEAEHFNFCNQWNLNIPRLEIGNFLELAYALREARFSLSNQSMLWNLAQAMGTKRVLEMCRYADNCFPNIGEYSEGYYHQMPAEYHFRTMYNKTK